MEKFKIQVCENTPEEIAKVVESIMPMGHIGVCCTSGDKEFAQKAMSGIKEFEYKLTYIEYPDGSVDDENTVADIVGAPDDIRLFVGIGNRNISSILGNACAKRNTPFLMVTRSPFLYGVGYGLSTPALPMQVFVDNSVYNARDDYASCIGAILAHRVGLWEKKYVYQMLGKYDYANIKREQDMLDGIIGGGEMADKAKIFDGILEYANSSADCFISSADVLADLIERCLLTSSHGESLLISAAALLKYFKAIMSVKDARLLIPDDLSSGCTALAKMSGMDMSEIIDCVKGRNFQSKWLYIHSEYREDMLAELDALDSKLLKIIKSAKRFMSDVGFHLSEEYDSGLILNLLYNLAPLTHECSPISMASYLGIINKEENI